MPATFIKTLNQVGDGTTKDIQEPTDDATFERQSRDVVKLYRYATMPVHAYCTGLCCLCVIQNQ